MSNQIKRCRFCGNLTENYVLVQRDCYKVKKFVCTSEVCAISLYKSGDQISAAEKSRIKCLVFKKIKKRLEI